MSTANPQILSGMGSLRAVADELISVTNEGTPEMDDVLEVSRRLENLMSDANMRGAALALAAAILNTCIVRSGYLVTITPNNNVHCNYIQGDVVRKAIAVMNLGIASAI